jgi:hypothetical protein
MKTPEIYKEVDTRELSLTDGDVLREHLLVLGAVCPGSSKAFFIYRTRKKILTAKTQRAQRVQD